MAQEAHPVTAVMSLKRKMEKNPQKTDNPGKEKTLKNIYFVTARLTCVGNALEILASAGEQTAFIYCNTEIKKSVKD